MQMVEPASDITEYVGTYSGYRQSYADAHVFSDGGSQLAFSGTLMDGSTVNWDGESLGSHPDLLEQNDYRISTQTAPDASGVLHNERIAVELNSSNTEVSLDVNGDAIIKQAHGSGDLFLLNADDFRFRYVPGFKFVDNQQFKDGLRIHEGESFRLHKGDSFELGSGEQVMCSNDGSLIVEKGGNIDHIATRLEIKDGNVAFDTRAENAFLAGYIQYKIDVDQNGEPPINGPQYYSYDKGRSYDDLRRALREPDQAVGQPERT